MDKRSNIKRIQLCNSHRPKIAGAGCCNDRGAAKLLTQFQAYIKEHKLEDQIEVIETACLRNCNQGISLRVLTDMTLYGNVKIQDIEDILQQHLIKGDPVERLIVSKISILDQF